MAKGRKRRRKKLHGDVMTTFDKVARRPRGDGYSAEGSASPPAAVDGCDKRGGGGGGWGSNAEAEMVCGVSSNVLY